jgi:Fe-S cluster assembly ATPase SufC
MSVLLITHYQRILNYIKPDHVHVMVRGRIVRSGGPELAEKRRLRSWRAATSRSASPPTSSEKEIGHARE